MLDSKNTYIKWICRLWICMYYVHVVLLLLLLLHILALTSFRLFSSRPPWTVDWRDKTDLSPWITPTLSLAPKWGTEGNWREAIFGHQWKMCNNKSSNCHSTYTLIYIYSDISYMIFDKILGVFLIFNRLK